MDDFEQFKTLVEEATTDVTVVKIAREQAVEPEGVTALLQSHGRAWVGKVLLFTGEQRKWFLGMESTTCEDAVKIVGMTAEHLAFYVNLVDKAVAGFERIDFSFDRSPIVDKMLSNSEIICEEREGKSQSMGQTSLVYSKKLPQPPSPSATTILISQ